MLLGRQARPVAAHAVALISTGPGGSRRRQRSRSSARRSGVSEATYAPAGPTPRLNGSHQCSKLAWRTRTVSMAGLDLIQPGLGEEPGQVAFAGAGQAGLIVGGRIQLAHGGPERG